MAELFPMRLFHSTLLLLATVAVCPAENVSALAAVKLLPKEQKKLLARIEGHDGTPVPERWHLLVFDPTTENGLREYVVADGALVASRTVSQFAETLTAEQTCGDLVKFDSDRGAKLAQDFARANSTTFATINYELRKDGLKAPPLWRLTCLDQNGRQVGSLTLTAAKGDVISHLGFVFEPTKENAERRSTPPRAPAPPRPAPTTAQNQRAAPVEVPVATPIPRRQNVLNRLLDTGNRLIGR